MIKDRRAARALICAVALALPAGCVERKFVITSDQPGTLVYRNGEPIGATPVDSTFTYYGTYQFTLVNDGYQTTRVEECIDAPWYAYPPFDFIVENLWPGRIQDVRRLHYSLPPRPQPRVDQLIGRGEALRARARGLPPPEPPRYPEFAPPG